MNDNFFLHHFPAPHFLDFPFVGIDISPLCVRMMEIIDHPSLKVGKYAEAILTTPFIISDSDQREVKEILKKWKKEYKLEYIKASLPEEKAYLFDTEVEFDTEEKMRSAIEFSLEDNVPLQGSEVFFDFRLVGESQKKGFIKVAVTVLPQDVVNAYLSLFKECDLQPISFLIEAQALTRAIVKKGDQGTHLIANISKTRTGIFIVSNGAAQFTSTVQIGSMDFTDAIEKQLGITTEEAEKRKETMGYTHADDNEILAPLMNVAKPFRDEIEKVYVYWNKHRVSTDQVVAIQKIIISGKEAVTPGFREYLAMTLKMPVEIANVWSNLASFDDYLPPVPLSAALNYGASIGLALPEKE